MPENNVELFFEKLSSDPNAKELFKGKEKPENKDELLSSYRTAARTYGYELTAEELSDYVREKSEERKRATINAAKAVQSLPDDALSGVAGGGDHEDCKDTFMDMENCWVTDACDMVFNMYDKYKCNSLYKDHCNAQGNCGSQNLWY
jgi:hypothetical protein